MKKNLFFISICCSLLGIAQQQLRGRILDEVSSSPLVGIAIMVNENKNAIITDKDGYFNISIPDKEAKIVISNKNYDRYTTDVKLPLTEILIIQLSPKTTAIEGVVLSTGYQNITKDRSTGSFVNVNNAELNQQVGSNIIDRLPAIANAVVMSRATEKPQLMIRGLSTINGPKAPLIIVDNFPYEGDINNINPNIVESINILKDAAASSIWGARAANGVIVITTKNGNFNRNLSFEFGMNTTISPKPNLDYLRTISSRDFIEMEKSLFEKGFYNNDITSPSHPILSPVVDLLNKAKNGIVSSEFVNNELVRLGGIDSKDQFRRYMYQPKINKQYYLNATGGSTLFSWISSLGFDDNTGSLGESYKRVNVSFKNAWKPNRQLKVNNSIFVTRTTSESGRTGYAGVNMKSSAVPYMEMASSDGKPLVVSSVYDQNYKALMMSKGLLDWNYYPLTNWKHSFTNAEETELSLNSSINYSILKGLDIDAKYQYQWASSDSNLLNDAESYYARNYVNQFAQINSDGTVKFIIPKGGILDKTNGTTMTNNLRGQLNYNRFFEKHNLSALVGAEIRDTKSTNNYNRYYGYNGETLGTAAVDYTKQYPTIIDASPSFIQRGQSLGGRNIRFVSLYTNASYTYDKKYIVSGSLRRDASNLFGLNTNDQWNPFWSAGIGWTLSNEAFYKLNFLPSLKFRATYGSNGNIDPAMVAVTTIAYYQEYSPYTNTPTARLDNYYNPLLKWETSHMFNLGFDFASSKDRLTGSIEYFNKKSDKLFGETPLDYTTGIVSMLWNVAAVEAKGWDINLRSLNINKAFKWSSIFNLSIYHDKVSKYYVSNDVGRNFVSSGNSALVSGIEGLPVYSIFAYRWAGLDPQTGDPKGYLDGQVSKDYSAIMESSIKSHSIEYFGSAIPTHYGSFINSASYKNFTLDVGITYKFGYWFRRNSIDYTALMTAWRGHSDYAFRWQKPGDELVTNVPSNLLKTNSSRDAFYNGSSVLVEKADHIRLQYIKLGYTLSKDYWKNIPLEMLQFYLNIDNVGLLWKANKSNIDPDYNAGSYILKPTTNISLGIRANF